MTETISNRELATLINDYWRDQGLLARAHVESRTFESAARKWRAHGKTFSSPGYKTTLEVIVSDTVNGLPTAAVASVRRAA